MGTKMKIFFLVVLFFRFSKGDWKNIVTRTSTKTQEDEVRSMLERVIPTHSQFFDIQIKPDITDLLDKVILKSSAVDEVVVVKVTANNGVAAAWGIHHYLKYFCKVHISWDVDQLEMPPILPEVDLTLNAQDRFRYHQNVCVYSYTFAFWNWDDWERHIDWMALNGINIPLAFSGQEEIWRRVYSKLGVSDEDLAAHFAGPGFLAWGRMGNLNSWGGPLWPGWHTFTVELQHKILSRMRGFGMTPILPAFDGHIPKGLIEIFKPNYTEQYWYGFGPTYLLEFSDPLFERIGASFIEEYQAEFGPSDHLYNCDTFNEMTPSTNDTTYLSDSGRAIFRAMTSGDPDAIWVMQGWIFYFEEDFWQLPQVEALLTSVPKGKMIILDLYSTHKEQYTRTKSYFGQPFIFNDLSNFGGNPGLFGHIETVNKGPAKARLPGQDFNSSMVGTGFTMEGLDLTYPTIDLLSEMSWRDSPVENLDVWMEEYVTRRYGRTSDLATMSWKTLIPGVLNSTLKETVSILTRLPDLHLVDNLGYNVEDVFEAWDLLILAVQADPDLGQIGTFRNDLVDMTRQALVLHASTLYNASVKAYFEENLEEFRDQSTLFLDLLDDFELILRTNVHFMLGPWIEAAKRLGETESEKDLLEYNARIQLTLWGPKGEHMDYAHKHWSGLVRNYYKTRWDLFFLALDDSLISGNPFDKEKFREVFFEEIGIPFTQDRGNYPTNPIGDTVEVALRLHEKFRPQVTVSIL